MVFSSHQARRDLKSLCRRGGLEGQGLEPPLVGRKGMLSVKVRLVGCQFIAPRTDNRRMLDVLNG